MAMIKFSKEIVLALKVWGLMMAMIKFSGESVLGLKVWCPAVLLFYQWTIIDHSPDAPFFSTLANNLTF